MSNKSIDTKSYILKAIFPRHEIVIMPKIGSQNKNME